MFLACSFLPLWSCAYFNERGGIGLAGNFWQTFEARKYSLLVLDYSEFFAYSDFWNLAFLLTCLAVGVIVAGFLIWLGDFRADRNPIRPRLFGIRGALILALIGITIFVAITEPEVFGSDNKVVIFFLIAAGFLAMDYSVKRTIMAIAKGK